MQKTQKDRRFRTAWFHHRPAYWVRKAVRTDSPRPFIECVHLQAGANAVEAPPVRIYLGTETAHYRAERVFVWSILQVRDPRRAYEIYLMKDLPGFRRDDWKTGFTKYRYAVPGLAGGNGRAIYNDVDQFYLADPARLFDTDMQGAGVMSVTAKDNSVMLIDCNKMLACWPEHDVRSALRHQRLRERAAAQGLWRALDGEWNARDGEYPLSAARCRHFTTLHRQPWMPFPEQLRYGDSPDADAWHELERAADAAGFNLFSRERPSRHYVELGRQYQQVHGNEEALPETEPTTPFDGRRLPKSAAVIGELVAATGSTSILDYGCGQGGDYRPFADADPHGRIKSHPAWPGARVICYDPGYAPYAEPWTEPVDGVISTDVIEHIPDHDVPWVLADLFGQARRFVYVLAACYPARMILPNGENAHCTVRSPAWWRGQMALAARRNPTVRWKLACEEKGLFGKKRSYFESGPASAGG